jgi:hypothetical protein
MDKKIQRSQNKSIQESNIDSFITSVFTKNYAAANKYLTAAISDKIKNRVAKAATQPLF